MFGYRLTVASIAPVPYISKDLHRTGTTGFTTDEEHAVLKRVLLAYARHNKAIGYCQGINILAALILKVVGFDEHMSLVVSSRSMAGWGGWVGVGV